MSILQIIVASCWITLTLAALFYLWDSRRQDYLRQPWGDGEEGTTDE